MWDCMEGTAEPWEASPLGPLLGLSIAAACGLRQPAAGWALPGAPSSTPPRVLACACQRLLAHRQTPWKREDLGIGTGCSAAAAAAPAASPAAASPAPPAAACRAAEAAAAPRSTPAAAARVAAGGRASGPAASERGRLWPSPARPAGTVAARPSSSLSRCLDASAEGARRGWANRKLSLGGRRWLGSPSRTD